MNLENLEKILGKEPLYRLKQAKRAIFRDLIENWSQASVFSMELKKRLEEGCPLEIEAEILSSLKGGAVKSLFVLKDGLKIESVLLRHKDARNTVCVSSQVGCALCCQFCSTGRLGFKRNLDYSEIIEQVLFFARLLKKEDTKITNVVFMGMGEPFLNYDNVLKAIKVLNDKDGFGLGARHFSISTVGIVEGIEKLAREILQVNLAISLHAPDDELRSKIMPINKKYPLGKILKAAKDYVGKTKRKLMFEYVMIRDLNDSNAEALKLAGLLRDIPLSFVNLISYNPAGDLPKGDKPSLPERIRAFKAVLEKEGVSCTQRYSFGQDINAACGQLAGRAGH